MIDRIRRKLSETEWLWADQDHNALQELARRIEEAALRPGLITYSELVEGVTFHIPTINAGRPFQIDTVNWSELDRAIVGDFLGRLSAESYNRSGIFVSAIVVHQEDRTPGPGFTKFMRDLGALTASGELAALEFWAREVDKVHQWYRQSRH